MPAIPPSTEFRFASRVDPRLGSDGLANPVRVRLDADPLSGHLFVFANRSADRVKVLYTIAEGEPAGGMESWIWHLHAWCG